MNYFVFTANKPKTDFALRNPFLYNFKIRLNIYRHLTWKSLAYFFTKVHLIIFS